MFQTALEEWESTNPDRRTQYIVLLEFAGIPFLLKSDSFPTNDQAVAAVDQCESRYGASIFIETTDVGLNNNDEAYKLTSHSPPLSRLQKLTPWCLSRLEGGRVA